MAKRTEFSEQHCSIARTLDVVGEWWTPLVLRDIFRGIRRFDELLENLEISRNVLTDRLRTLVNEGVLERRRYQERPDRYEYVLTEAGRDLFPVLIALMNWGDKWKCCDNHPPVTLIHECGKPISPLLACGHCKREIRRENVKLADGQAARLRREPVRRKRRRTPRDGRRKPVSR